MSVLFKNNAYSTLADAVGTADLGLTVATGEGTRFPALSGGDYFYLTIEDMNGIQEIVKVTARSGDDMTIVRAQEDTNAFAFSAGALCELKVTAQGFADAVSDAVLSASSITLDKLQDISAQRFLGRNTAGTGAVEQVTTSQALDWLGATQGQLLYRGASGWTVLSPGTLGQVLNSGGPGDNPSWVTGASPTDGDKGDITVSSSGTTWTIDAGAVSLAKQANLNQYELVGRSSSGAGVPQAVATSADVFAMLASANDAALRTEIGLGTMATQASSAVAVTGGTIAGLSELQGTMKLCTNTTGTLALADANTFVPMTGDCTLDGGVFSDRQAFLFWSGASGRSVIQGTSMTLRLGGSATTGTRTLAAHTLAVGVVIGTNEIAITGIGVS